MKNNKGENLDEHDELHALREHVRELEILNAKLQDTDEEIRDLALAMRHSSELVNLSELDGTMTFLNEAGGRMLGIDPERVGGTNIMEVIPDHLTGLVEDELLPALTRGDTWEGDLQYRNLKTGKLTDVHAVTFTVKDPDTGKPKFLANISQDITERKRVEENLRNSQERLRVLFEEAPDAYYLCDLKGYFVDGNKATETVTGYGREELVGKSFLKLKLLSPKDIAKSATLLAKSALGLSTGPEELMLHRKDGTQIPVEIRAHPVKIGEQTLVLGLARDISKRKHAEEELRTGEERYRLLFENMMNGFALHQIVLDGEGRPVDYVFLEVNSAFERLTGLRGSDLIGNKVSEALPGIESDPADWIGKCGNVALTGEEASFEQYAESLGKWFSVLAFSPREGQFATVFEDITERKRAEQRFRLISDVSTDLIYEWTVDGDHLEWYGPLDKTLGYEPGEIPRTIAGWVSLIHPEDQEKLKGTVERHRTSTRLIYEEYRIRRKDGTWAYWVDRGIPVLGDNGQPYMWIGGCLDITEQKQAAEALRDSEERFRSITEQMSDMIFFTDSEGAISYISPASTAIFGCAPEEMVDRNFVDFLDPSNVSRAVAAFRETVVSGTPSPTIELQMRRISGEAFTGELNARRYEMDASWARLA